MGKSDRKVRVRFMVSREDFDYLKEFEQRWQDVGDSKAKAWRYMVTPSTLELAWLTYEREQLLKIRASGIEEKKVGQALEECERRMRKLIDDIIEVQNKILERRQGED